MTDQDGYRQRAARTRERRSHEALLKAGASMFAERGWKRTKLEDVAEAAGVGRATVFKHFGSKGALVGAIYAELASPLIERTLNDLDTRDPVDLLYEYLFGLVKLAYDNQTLTKCLLQALSEEAVSVTTNEREGRVSVPLASPLAKIFKAGQKAGVWHPLWRASHIADYQILSLLTYIGHNDEPDSEQITSFVYRADNFHRTYPDDLLKRQIKF